MPLRKVLIATTGVAANAGSFTNVTADNIDIRKVIGKMWSTTAETIGEINLSSLDENSTNQSTQNDSRSHIATMVIAVDGGTASVTAKPDAVQLAFNRNDLILRTDESMFVNNSQVVGGMTPQTTWNLFYEA